MLSESDFRVSVRNSAASVHACRLRVSGNLQAFLLIAAMSTVQSGTQTANQSNICFGSTVNPNDCNLGQWYHTLRLFFKLLCFVYKKGDSLYLDLDLLIGRTCVAAYSKRGAKSMNNQ